MTPSELTGFLGIVDSVGSVGWAIVAWFAFAAKNAIMKLCESAAQYLKSIAETNSNISHDIKNMRMELQSVYERIEEHERVHHGLTPGQSGPRFVPRSSRVKRPPIDEGSEP